MKNSIKFINISVTANQRSTQVLPENTNRKAIIIQNNSTTTIYITFGHSASINSGMRLIPTANFESYAVTSSSVHIVTAPGTTADNIIIIEGTPDI